MIVKSKRMFVMDRAFAEKIRQRRSLPSRSPLKPALARKRPKRPRAGRLPILSSHVLSEIRVKSVYTGYIMQHITNFRCKTSQRTISLKVRSVLKNDLSPTGKDGHIHLKCDGSGGSGLAFTHTPSPLPTFRLGQNDSLFSAGSCGKGSTQRRWMSDEKWRA